MQEKEEEKKSGIVLAKEKKNRKIQSAPHIPHHVCHSYFFLEVLYEKK